MDVYPLVDGVGFTLQAEKIAQASANLLLELVSVIDLFRTI
jgi:hypothetical protein